MPTPSSDYAPVQRALHWLMAAMIFGLIGVGLWIPTVGDDPADRPFKDLLYDIHKWTGIVVLALAVWRLRLRMTRPVADVPGLTRFEAFASRRAHQLVYLLMILMPLTGWASSSALGFPVVWLGVLPLPDIAPRDTALGFRLLDVHRTLAWTLIVVLAVHVGAALRHHFVQKDGVLRRMLGGAS